MLLFLVTLCLLVAVEPCMEWIPIKKISVLGLFFTRTTQLISHELFYIYKVKELCVTDSGQSDCFNISCKTCNQSKPLKLAKSNQPKGGHYINFGDFAYLFFINVVCLVILLFFSQRSFSMVWKNITCIKRLVVKNFD